MAVSVSWHNASEFSGKTAEDDIEDGSNTPESIKASEDVASMENHHTLPPPPPYEETVAPPAFETDPSLEKLTQPTSVSTKGQFPVHSHTGKENHHNSSGRPSTNSKRDANFTWEQVSSRARLKLIFTERNQVCDEFIQEMNAKKIEDGVRG